MSSDFELHPTLEADTFTVAKLALCKVRLMNNAEFPWLILVPMRENLREITDLSKDEQHLLMDEIALMSETLQAVTGAEKMNVAALGNQVSQLHVHVIARSAGDAAWPNPVWGGPAKAYAEEDAKALIHNIHGHILANNG